MLIISGKIDGNFKFLASEKVLYTLKVYWFEPVEAANNII